MAAGTRPGRRRAGTGRAARDGGGGGDTGRDVTGATAPLPRGFRPRTSRGPAPGRTRGDHLPVGTEPGTERSAVVRRQGGPGATVCLLGTVDTKHEEYRRLRDRLREAGVAVALVDAGGYPGGLPAEVPAQEVAAAREPSPNVASGQTRGVVSGVRHDAGAHASRRGPQASRRGAGRPVRRP
ncbi:Tm-1-like ATP-binding domain-containing protein [Streptomyces sp. NPDC014733]|uniref:Tm-1-like ATP-binding domain-containing protein n=1 Tax=Streptomyces sp. NPDC014733 TaxID=3364885 RepID=UPI0037014175